MSKHKEENFGLPNDVSRGINGIFRGLTGLVNAAAKLTEQAEASEIARSGSLGTPEGVQASYGVAVRMGRQTRPVSQPVRNLRRRAESAPPAQEIWEPNTDIFDEGDHYVVVAEFSGFDASAIHWNVIGNALLIDGVCEHRVCHKELILPSMVKEHSITSSFKNGILEMRLWKQ